MHPHMSMYSHLLHPCVDMLDHDATSQPATSPTMSGASEVRDEDNVDNFGDIFYYRERPVRVVCSHDRSIDLIRMSVCIQLSLTICIGVGDQPLPRVSVSVFHDREYLEEEGALRAAWLERTRWLERSIAARLTGVVRDILVDAVMREAGRQE